MLYNIDIRHSTRYLSTILPRCGFSVIFLSNTAAGCLQSFFLFFSIYITRTRYRQVFFYGEFFLPEKRKICFLVLSMLIPHARHCLFACSPVLSPLCVAYAIRCTRLMLSPPPAIWCKLLTYRSRILRKNSYSLESFFLSFQSLDVFFFFGQFDPMDFFFVQYREVRGTKPLNNPMPLPLHSSYSQPIVPSSLILPPPPLPPSGIPLGPLTNAVVNRNEQNHDAPAHSTLY